jgi:hypothetical protein
MVNLFLDSGAFSAFTKGVEININDYIDYIKRYKKYIDVYANLDVIGDAEGTLVNQKKMEEAGLSPMPCFHAGEDWSYLDYYIKNYDYIALGGVAQLGRKAELWMEYCFNMVCDQPSRLPKCKVHGFAVTSTKLMFKFPWYSVDSTSWVMTSRMGSVFVPRFKQGKYDYHDQPWKVTVSNRSPLKKEPQSDSSWHIDNFSPLKQDVIINYFKSKGLKLGISEYRQESSDYELKEGERWYGKEEADGVRDAGLIPKGGWSKDGIVEIVIEDGLSNNYMKRDLANIFYYIDLEKSFPEWPWPWGKPRQKGLLI